MKGKWVGYGSVVGREGIGSVRYGEGGGQSAGSWPTRSGQKGRGSAQKCTQLAQVRESLFDTRPKRATWGRQTRGALSCRALLRSRWWYSGGARPLSRLFARRCASPSDRWAQDRLRTRPGWCHRRGAALVLLPAQPAAPRPREAGHKVDLRPIRGNIVGASGAAAAPGVGAHAAPPVRRLDRAPSLLFARQR